MSASCAERTPPVRVAADCGVADDGVTQHGDASKGGVCRLLGGLGSLRLWRKLCISLSHFVQYSSLPLVLNSNDNHHMIVDVQPFIVSKYLNPQKTLLSLSV